MSGNEEENETVRGIGLPATIGLEISREVAIAAESAGYHSFWLNNPPGHAATDILGQVVAATRDIYLGVGIIPVSHTTSEKIVSQVTRHALPLERFYLGIGSGSGADGLQRVRDAIEAIRSQVNAQIVVAALGPKMCRLAGAMADGVLLNWLTPDFAAPSIDWVRQGADENNRPMPRLLAYVRVALGVEAGARLTEEAKRYAAIPQYAAHFRRMGVAAIDTAIRGDTASKVQEGLAVWDGIVDELVIRATPGHDTTPDVLAVLDAAKPVG